MATKILDLDGRNPAIPLVVVRFDGEIGEPLVAVPGALLTPEAAIEYAKAIFSAAATACRQARHVDVAGRC
jgi:hypothetical protein